MNNPLAIYLHDHAAGAQVAVDLLANLQREHEGEALEQFAAGLLGEIEQDVAVLERLIDRAGDGPSKTAKKAVTWLAEKGSRLKLRRRASQGLGTFEALETLALGILGKRALWQALAEIAPTDARLAGEDFDALAQRAEDQYARVETLRLKKARETLTQK